MQTPLHPFVAHFPIAITFLMPILAIVFAILLKKNKMSPISWAIIVGLQLFVVATGYVALESGEEEEERVEKVVDEKFIEEHEEAAEIFVGSAVIALVISIAAFFIRKEYQFHLQILMAIVALVSCFLAARTGQLGGRLVYIYGAPLAYKQEAPQGILPTPGLNTSESSTPKEENESLKKDDNDYGNNDEESDTEDDDSKQED
ncbi:MAG: DUF2231 domain-containing protein [Bacteriovoracaceae bacterium]